MLLIQGRDLDDRLPVDGGVDESSAADAQSYVCDLFPPKENQVSCFQNRPAHDLQVGLGELDMGIAQEIDSVETIGELHKGRAIDAQWCGPAPEVGQAQKASCRGDYGLYAPPRLAIGSRGGDQITPLHPPRGPIRQDHL
jgi:hypothetical protein